MPRVASVCPPEDTERVLARLRQRRDFLRLSASRSKVVTPAFVLQARAQPDAASCEARVGFTASRRIGGAVVRNRARRRLKALAARVLAARARVGWDYVLIARAEAVTRPWPSLVADLEDALARLERGPGPAASGGTP